MRALGSLVFGHIGDTPMAAVHMIRHSGYDLAPAILIMATAAISFVVILGIRLLPVAILSDGTVLLWGSAAITLLLMNGTGMGFNGLSIRTSN